MHPKKPSYLVIKLKSSVENTTKRSDSPTEELLPAIDQSPIDINAKQGIRILRWGRKLLVVQTKAAVRISTSFKPK